MVKNNFNIIPMPNYTIFDKGAFGIDKNTSVATPETLLNEAWFLQQILKEEINLSLSIDNKQETNNISLNIEDSYKELGAEGYKLTVSQSGIAIKAKTSSGIFYGLQTLRQLITPEKKNSAIIEIPFLEIIDTPRFKWRGFMLDIARHFFDTDVIKQLIDSMALLKLNILHLHLCDDQGWRMQIDSLPRLTEIGATRPETQTGGFLSKKTDKTPHSGYLKKTEIKEIIDYATERHITVVPEIEMPGHCSAALAAYPELGCTGGPYQVATFSGIKKDIYCAGKEETFSFLTKVLDEVIDLFPSPWIHIGGDEAPKNRWKSCPLCQNRIKSEGLQDESELQDYFINRMVKYLEKKGKTVIGWNEILSGQLPPSVIGQYWLRNKKEVLQHLKKGGKIIGSHFFHSYLDYNHGVLPLSKIYGYNPVPQDLKKEHHKNVIGIESPMWTETITSPEHLHAYVFPRLVAMSENAWTKAENKPSFGDFLDRLPIFLQRLKDIGIAHTSIKDSEPSSVKRIIMWLKLSSQSAEIPASVEYSVSKND